MARIDVPKEPVHWLYNPNPTVFHSSGDTIQYDYIEQFDEFGKPYLVESGQTDLVELHQIDKDSGNVSLLFERYAAGDLGAFGDLDRAETFVDITTAPRDLMEVQNQLLRAQRAFSMLPEALKLAYGSNFRAWLAAELNPELEPEAAKAYRQQLAARQVPASAAASVVEKGDGEGA